MKLRTFLIVFHLVFHCAQSSAQASYVQLLRHQQNSRGPFIDSLIISFEHTKDRHTKLHAAFQLYDEFHFTEARLLVLSKKIDIDTVEINTWKMPYYTYITEDRDILNDPAKRIEFKLLQAKTEKQYEAISAELAKTRLAPELDSLFKGIIILRKNHLAFSAKKIPHKRHGLKQALSILPRKPAYLFILNSICNLMGRFHYQQQELDSAAYYYNIVQSLFELDKTDKYSYITGYGTDRRAEFIGATYMNLGLIHERKGNLVSATDYFALANNIFRQESGFKKQWSEMRLANAFFDLGDHRSARKLLRTMSAENFNFLRNLERYGPYIIISMLGELDLDQLKSNASLLDSIMRIEMDFFYQGKELSPDASEKKRAFYYSNRAELALYDELFQQMLPGRNAYFEPYEFTNAQTHFPDFKVKGDKWKQQFNVVNIYSLASQISALEINNELLDKLISEYAHASVVAQNIHPLLEVSYLFNAHAAFSAELAVLKKIIPALEKTAHIVELSKAYRQISECFEHLGEYKRSIRFRNKYDALLSKMNQMNQHSTLAKLDKELQVSRAHHEKALAEKEFSTLLHKKNRLISVVVSIILLFVLLVAIFYLNRKRILADRKRLAAENEALEANLLLEEEKVKRSSLEIAKGNQSLSQLIGDVESLKKDLNPQHRKKLLGLLIEHKTKTQDETWQQFSLQFESDHQGFYKKLVAKYKLTSSEQRLCAMHLNDMSNKEITAITGQKLSSIHTMKSKIRKKLQVDNDEQLLVILKSINE